MGWLIARRARPHRRYLEPPLWSTVVHGWGISAECLGVETLSFVVGDVGSEPFRIETSKRGDLSAVCACHEVLTVPEGEDRKEKQSEPGAAAVQAMRALGSMCRRSVLPKPGSSGVG